MGAAGAMTGVSAGLGLVGSAANVALQNRIDRNRITGLYEEIDFFEEQAHLSKLALDREVDLFKQDAARFQAEQSGAFVKGGVSLEGSALLQMAETATGQQRELRAMKIAGQAQIREAEMNARRAQRAIDEIRDTQHLRAFATMMAGTSGSVGSFSALGSRRSSGGGGGGGGGGGNNAGGGEGGGQYA